MKNFTKILLMVVILCAGAAYAQSAHGTYEVAGQFTTVYANAAPGDCGCFFMYGGSAQFAAVDHKGFGVVADFGLTHASNINGYGHNLTLSTYMGGVRYYPIREANRVSVYAQVLAGAAHTTSNYIIDNDATRFGAAVGGGVNYKLSQHLRWRVAEVEYLLTRVPNAQNEVQNQTRLSSGLVLTFGR